MTTTTPLTKQEKEQLYQRLLAFTKEGDNAFELDGPLMCTVRLGDKTYRNHSIGQSDFYFSEVRLNEKDDAIFGFEPEEALDNGKGQAIEVVEVKMAKVDSHFPLFVGAMKEFCRQTYIAPVTDAEDADMLRIMLEAIEFAPDAEKMMIQLEEQRKVQAVEAERLEMLNNPQFGMF